MGPLQATQISTKDLVWKDRLMGVVGRVTSFDSDVHIYLFGSFLTGQFYDCSDLDVAVIHSGRLSTMEFLRRVYKQGSICDWPLDLLVLPKRFYDEQKNIGGVCQVINESGIELYPKWSLKI